MQIKKKILIIGGCGEIGQQIIHRSSEYDFFVFDKHKIKGINKNVKFIKGNMLIYSDLRRIPKKFDILIFLAGIKGGNHSTNIKSASQFFNKNLNTLKNFLEFSPKLKFKKIVFSSTEQVYGNNYNTFKCKKYEVKPINYYGLSKLASEKILYQYWLNNHIGIDILRFPRVISRENNNIIKKLILKSFLRNKIILDNNLNFNFIFIDDLINAIKKTLTYTQKYRILNIFNNNKPITLLKLCKIIQNKLKKKSSITFLKRKKKNHNPHNLNISNYETKKILKWKPKFYLNKIIDTLIIGINKKNNYIK